MVGKLFNLNNHFELGLYFYFRKYPFFAKSEVYGKTNKFCFVPLENLKKVNAKGLETHHTVINKACFAIRDQCISQSFNASQIHTDIRKTSRFGKYMTGHNYKS